MSIVLAVTKAYDDVVAQFAADATACTFGFGWRELQKQDTAVRRIVVQPGDVSGSAGDIGSARFPGRNPRPLGTLDELFTVFVQGHDATNPEDERAQYQWTRELWDAYYRALYLSAHGTFRVISLRWDTSKNLRRRGAMLVAVVAIQSMIPDTSLETLDDGTARAASTASLDAADDESGTADSVDYIGADVPRARAATTAAITLSGTQPVDGVALIVDDIVLVKDQSNAATNGRYTVAAGAWTPVAGDVYAVDFFVHVAEGSTNGDAGFAVTVASPLTFSRVSP